MIVKVLGTGCSKCKLLTRRLTELKAARQMDFEIESVTRIDDIMGYGIMMTPGLVIDEVVKSVGRVPSDSQLLTWIQEVS